MEALTYVAFLGLSWVAGALTLIAPAGIGVREFVFILLAQTMEENVDLEVLAAIAIVARCWLIVQELIGVILVYIYFSFSPDNANNARPDVD